MNFPFPAGQSTPFKLTFKTDADEVAAAAGTAAAAVANTNELEVAVGPKFCHSWKVRLIMRASCFFCLARRYHRLLAKLRAAGLLI